MEFEATSFIRIKMKNKLSAPDYQTGRRMVEAYLDSPEFRDNKLQDLEAYGIELEYSLSLSSIKKESNHD